jgi:hypothetical protein
VWPQLQLGIWKRKCIATEPKNGVNKDYNTHKNFTKDLSLNEQNNNKILLRFCSSSFEELIKILVSRVATTNTNMHKAVATCQEFTHYAKSFGHRKHL